MAPPNLYYEKNITGIIAGVDEAGCGPWAGPVVAAAVIFTGKMPRGIDDSKKLTLSERDSLYMRITKVAETGVGIASVEEIDALNILQAAKLAMRRAVEALPRLPDVALIDGHAARAPDLECEIQMVIGGDYQSRTIAAASVIAKVTRDRIMTELALAHPHYGWETNAGYGTKKHQHALAEHGVTIHHRRSFRPIRELLGIERDVA